MGHAEPEEMLDDIALEMILVNVLVCEERTTGLGVGDDMP